MILSKKCGLCSYDTNNSVLTVDCSVRGSYALQTPRFKQRAVLDGVAADKTCHVTFQHAAMTLSVQ